MRNATVCSRFHHAVELIGGRWSGPILQATLSGRRRYADIKTAVPGLSDTMLTQRLRELETEGVLERRVVPTSPVRVEYYPTEKGRALGPVLAAIAAWAEEWVQPAGEQANETERLFQNQR
ncbi:MAG: catDE operon transcriptional regulator CatR [Chloroflexota bacterium]